MKTKRNLTEEEIEEQRLEEETQKMFALKDTDKDEYFRLLRIALGVDDKNDF